MYTLQDIESMLNMEYYDNEAKSKYAVCRMMYRLYMLQTDSERISRNTKFENGVGFNKIDADFLTGLTKLYIDKEMDYKIFTSKQFEAINKTIKKYKKQLLLIANGEL